jgi:hypothetical protein
MSATGATSRLPRKPRIRGFSSCNWPNLRRVALFLLPFGLPDRFANPYWHCRPWRRQRVQTLLPDRLHFTLDCRQFSQAVRSLGVSPPAYGLPLDSASIFWLGLVVDGGVGVGNTKPVGSPNTISMTIPIARGSVTCGYKWKEKGETGKLEIENQINTIMPHTSNEVDASHPL